MSETDSIPSKRLQIDQQSFMLSSDERTPFAKQPHHSSTTFINHACYTIGENLYGQQGNGTQNSLNKYLRIMGKLPTDIYINDIVIGRLGSVYLVCDNYENLITFGNNGDGQLMIGNKCKQLIYSWCHSNSVPIEIIDCILEFIDEPITEIQETQNIPIVPLYFKLKIDDKIKLISSGIDSSHRFIMTESNQLYGIGYNKYMQLGIDTVDYRTNSLLKVNYFNKNQIRIKKIACNQLNSIFLSIYGEMFWCGAIRSSDGNAKGELRKLQCIYNIKDIDCNKFNLLAVDSGKRIYYAPFSINGLKMQKSKYFKEKKVQIMQIKCGLLHNVILDNKGLIYCFGNNEFSQCGRDKDMTFKFEKPSCIDHKRYFKDETIVDIKCGGYHNVVKTKSNEYYLWGRNHCRQCLIYDGKEIIETPTKYENNMDIGAAYDIVAIYPGFNETKIVVKHKNMY